MTFTERLGRGYWEGFKAWIMYAFAAAFFAAAATITVYVWWHYHDIVNSPVVPSALGVPLTELGLPVVVFVLLGLTCTHLASVNIVKGLYEVSLRHGDALRRARSKLKRLTREKKDALAKNLPDSKKLERLAAAKQLRSARKLFGNRPCGFCGAETAPLICASCKSIQWSAIEHDDDAHWVLDPGEPLENDPRFHPRLIRSASAFFAEHRLPIGGAILAVVVGGALSFSSSLRDVRGQVEQRAETEQWRRSERAITTAASYRSALMLFRDECGPSRASQPADGADRYQRDRCAHLFDEITDHYFQLSWSAEPALAYLRARRCARLLDGRARQSAGVAPRAASQAADAESDALVDSACRATDYRLVDLADDAFKIFYDAIDQSRAHGPYLRDLASTERLNEAGRTLACVLHILDAPSYEREPQFESSCDRDLPGGAEFAEVFGTHP